MQRSWCRRLAQGSLLACALGALACEAAFPGSTGVDPIDGPIGGDDPEPPAAGAAGQSAVGEPRSGGGTPPAGGQGESGVGGGTGGRAGSRMTGGGAGSGTSSGAFPPLPADPCDYPASKSVEVDSVRTLQDALTTSTPGTRIELAPGSYGVSLRIERAGRAGSPIIVCGPRTAVLQSGRSDDVIRIRADHIVLSGFMVRGGLRGIITDGAEGVLLSALEVHDIGQEAIHLRSGSRNNLVRSCRIHNTGVSKPQFGEGVYVGSAVSAWAEYGGGSDEPDRSDGNFILDNHIGPDVRAEHVDVKEGTTGGTIRGNTFDGRGMSGDGYADSWIDVKGNDWVIADNQGKIALKDGFQVHVVTDGWGRGNVFRANSFELDGSGYGVWIEQAARDNKVSCDNRIIGRAKGLANVACE